MILQLLDGFFARRGLQHAVIRLKRPEKRRAHCIIVVNDEDGFAWSFFLFAVLVHLRSDWRVLRVLQGWINTRMTFTASLKVAPMVAPREMLYQHLAGN